MDFYTKEEIEKISLTFGNHIEYISFLLKETTKLLKRLEEKHSKYKRFIYFGDEIEILTITNLQHLKFISHNDQSFILFFSGLLENFYSLKKMLELFLIGKALFIKGLKELSFLVPKEMKLLELELEKFLKLVPAVYINKHHNIAYTYSNVDLELREEFFITKKIKIKRNELEKEDELRIKNFLNLFDLKGLIIKGNTFKVINLKNGRFLIELGKNEILIDNEIKVINMN